MAKASKKIRKAMMSDADKAAKTARDIGVPEAQIARGFALHKVTEGGQTIGQTVRNLYPMIVDRWLAEGGPGFDEPQRRAIDHCRSLWERLGSQGRLVANYGGMACGSDGEGWTQQEAFAQLAEYQSDIPFAYWQVFENVCRFDMPAGTAGSHLERHRNSQTTAAKQCVGFVASLIAQWRGF
jgi:hypothetical protein